MVLGVNFASYDVWEADLIQQTDAHGADLCSKKSSPVLLCPDMHRLLESKLSCGNIQWP